MAHYEDIVIDQGTDVAIRIELTETDGNPKNLTGYSVNSQIRRTILTSDSDAVSFTSIVVSPATAGIVTLGLTNIQTDAMVPGRHFYDVELSHIDSNSNTIIERVLEGQVKVTPSITRL